ncbi:hypothetical protein HYW99_03105 [Candidatus Woesearchaeota archaeon]|nr:hypothetical protein [Candidatus Woesearchaeota archaeon]
MRFIITIDDAEEETLKTLLEENIDIPLVIGLPVGLLNKDFENKKISSKELVFKLIKNLDIEITSHGYFHNLPSLGFQKNLKIFISRIKSAPDKFDYLFRALYFQKKKAKSEVNQKNEVYDHFFILVVISLATF